MDRCHLKGERGMVIEMPHPTAGRVKNIISPFRFDGRQISDHAAPPLLGQHTSEILGHGMGLTHDQLHDLHARGVLKILSSATSGEQIHG